MDAPDFDANEVFLEALEAAVLAALERIGDDPEARFRFFRQLLWGAREALEPSSKKVRHFGELLDS